MISGGVASYSAPEGSEPLQGLIDSSYDGVHDSGYLTGGLGRLTDGEVGADNFRLDIGYGKGKYHINCIFNAAYFVWIGYCLLNKSKKHKAVYY